MEIWEIVVVSLALAMDAFAVSICKGLASGEKFIKTGIACGLWFGFFQALMPFLGWLLGTTVASYVESYSAWIAFALLTFLGVKMIREAILESKNPDEEDGEKHSSLAPKIMVVFAVATSIDALAAGLTFAALDVNIWLAISLIGIITCVCSFFGSIIGAKIGSKFKNKAEIAGGIILLGIGLKILIEHLITLM